MTEKNFQTFFTGWTKKNPPKSSEVYELKICKNSSFAFDSVKPHQIEALVKAEESNLYHKISDQPWGRDNKFRFTIKKPFDCLVLVNVLAFVVIWFYHERAKKVFIKISIKKFIAERDKKERKSLTEKRASEIGESIAFT